MQGKCSILEFNRQFSDHDSCLKFLFEKNHKGKICPYCKKKTAYYKVRGRQCFECGDCGHQIYPMKGTIFERSTTPLNVWFSIMYLLTNSKNGVSSLEISRHYGLTYKTAWRITKKIRELMADKSNTFLQGIVEMDESYLGNAKYNDEKSKIFGIVEREGRRLRLFNLKKKFPTQQNIEPIILKNVAKTATIYSDKGACYQRLNLLGYEHKSISHKAAFKYSGGVHTNRIEAVWSRYKMSVLGTHRWVSDKWRQLYLDEFAFRYSYNHMPKNPVFYLLDLL